MKFTAFIFSLFALFITSCSDDESTPTAQTMQYDFAAGQHGWTHGFSDYLNANIEEYELEGAYTDRPAITGNGKSYMISGDNHSDDLFMFLKKEVTGLKANTTYSLTFTVRFASNAPTGSVGVGGAPGEGVTMKVGASKIEPISALSSDNHFRMNIDHGIQTVNGNDMVAVGHIGVSATTTDFTIIERSNKTTPTFSVTTDGQGKLWLIVGTDSGFEAKTTLYYTHIEVTFAEQ